VEDLHSRADLWEGGCRRGRGRPRFRGRLARRPRGHRSRPSAACRGTPTKTEKNPYSKSRVPPPPTTAPLPELLSLPRVASSHPHPTQPRHFLSLPVHLHIQGIPKPLTHAAPLRHITQTTTRAHSDPSTGACGEDPVGTCGSGSPPAHVQDKRRRERPLSTGGVV
jgi:hypothetical protein